MPDLKPEDLFPTRMRLNFLLYDPLTQRYHHISKQSRHCVIENEQQWNTLTQAIDATIARLNANR